MMGAETIAQLALEGTVEVAGIIKRALDSARAGDESVALQLLDEALAKNKTATDALPSELDGIRQRVLSKIEAGEI